MMRLFKRNKSREEIMVSQPSNQGPPAQNTRQSRQRQSAQTVPSHPRSHTEPVAHVGSHTVPSPAGGSAGDVDWEDEDSVDAAVVRATRKERNMSISKSGRHKMRGKERGSVLDNQFYSRDSSMAQSETVSTHNNAAQHNTLSQNNVDTSRSAPMIVQPNSKQNMTSAGASNRRNVPVGGVKITASQPTAVKSQQSAVAKSQPTAVKSQPAAVARVTVGSTPGASGVDRSKVTRQQAAPPTAL